MSPVTGCPQTLLKETLRCLYLSGPSDLLNCAMPSKTFELTTSSNFFPYKIDLSLYNCMGLVLSVSCYLKCASLSQSFAVDPSGAEYSSPKRGLHVQLKLPSSQVRLWATLAG